MYQSFKGGLGGIALAKHGRSRAINAENPHGEKGKGGMAATTRWLRMCVGASTFLSTPSARRATKPEWAKSLKGIISIHALREEGDHPPTKPKEARHDFYPRPPRGGRLEVSARVPPPNRFLSTPSARRATLDNGFVSAAELFLSTPSARRATRMPRPPAADLRISIHALREEGDPSAPTAWAT